MCASPSSLRSEPDPGLSGGSRSTEPLESSTATTGDRRARSPSYSRLGHARSGRGSCQPRGRRVCARPRRALGSWAARLAAPNALAGAEYDAARQRVAPTHRSERASFPTASRPSRDTGAHGGRRWNGLCPAPSPLACAYRRAARPSLPRARLRAAARGGAPSSGGAVGGATPIQRTKTLTRICIGMHLRLACYRARYGTGLGGRLRESSIDMPSGNRENPQGTALDHRRSFASPRRC